VIADGASTGAVRGDRRWGDTGHGRMRAKILLCSHRLTQWRLGGPAAGVNSASAQGIAELRRLSIEDLANIRPLPR
jgi:hypothetical protein